MKFSSRVKGMITFPFLKMKDLAGLRLILVHHQDLEGAICLQMLQFHEIIHECSN